MNNQTAEAIKFEVGKTYYTRSACDHNCIYTVKVLGRTPKTIKALVDGRNIKTLRPSVYRNAEQVKPHGSYSMAAIVDATDTKELFPDWHKAAVSGEPLPQVGVSRYAPFSWLGGDYRASVKENGYTLIERSVDQGYTWTRTNSLNLLAPATQALRDCGVVS